MPCYMSDDSVRAMGEWVEAEHQKPRPQDECKIRELEAKVSHYENESQRLSTRCANLTVLLCAAGRARYNKTDIPVAVLQWWEEHCEIDRLHGEPW